MKYFNRLAEDVILFLFSLYGNTRKIKKCFHKKIFFMSLEVIQILSNLNNTSKYNGENCLVSNTVR